MENVIRPYYAKVMLLNISWPEVETKANASWHETQFLDQDQATGRDFVKALCIV